MYSQVLICQAATERVPSGSDSSGCQRECIVRKRLVRLSQRVYRQVVTRQAATENVSSGQAATESGRLPQRACRQAARESVSSGSDSSGCHRECVVRYRLVSQTRVLQVIARQAGRARVRQQVTARQAGRARVRKQLTARQAGRARVRQQVTVRQAGVGILTAYQ